MKKSPLLKMFRKQSQVNLVIDAEGTQRYNKIATALVAAIESPQISPVPNGSQFQPDYHVSAHITDADIAGEIEIGLPDAFGNEEARCFYVQRKPFGLGGNAYQQFIKLVEDIQRTPSFQFTVSQSLLSKHLFAWIKGAWLGSLHCAMTEYVIPKCESEIATLEVWVPISLLFVQSDIPIGNITIKPITRNLFDELYKHMLEGPKDHHEEIASFIEKKRKALQGSAAGVMNITAEPERAREIAVEETDRAVSLLRLFHPASMSPKINCYCTIKGHENLKTTTSFSLHNEKHHSWNECVMDAGARQWKLSEDDITAYRRDGLDSVCSLLLPSRSEFQNDILDALLLYSKVSLSRELTDKLVFLFVALENMFLKNKNERIKKNLSRRIASFVGTEYKRDKIEQRIKDIYKVRSDFIHHAEKISDVEILANFMMDAWCAMMNVVNAKDVFQTKADFISAIDSCTV